MPQTTLQITAPKRGLIDITAAVAAAVAHAGVQTGLCNVFVHHTSASLIVQENADDRVLLDLEDFLLRLVPDGDPRYRHAEEGPDDMAAHIRGAITATSVGLPVIRGRLGLGTWQGIFLWEHRARPRGRTITVTVVPA